jgi:hypothetical protein
MKTVVKNGVSLMIVDDKMPIKVGDRVEIGAIKLNNSDGSVVVYDNVTPPIDYVGKKYKFDGNAWTLNNEGNK